MGIIQCFILNIQLTFFFFFLKKKKKESYRAFGQNIKEENLENSLGFVFLGEKGQLGQKLLNLNYRFLLVQYQRNCSGTWSFVLHAVKK